MTVKLVFPVAENTEITNNGEQRLLRRNKKKTQRRLDKSAYCQGECVRADEVRGGYNSEWDR